MQSALLSESIYEAVHTQHGLNMVYSRLPGSREKLYVRNTESEEFIVPSPIPAVKDILCRVS